MKLQDHIIVIVLFLMLCAIFTYPFIHHQAKVVLPIMIGPNEEITLSELTNNLKINY